MRKERGSWFAVSTLAAFAFVAWSILAAAAAMPASAAESACQVTCDINAENCVQTADCAWQTCAGITNGSCQQPEAFSGLSGNPTPTVGQCLDELAGDVVKCDVQHAICDFVCKRQGNQPQ